MASGAIGHTVNVADGATAPTPGPAEKRGSEDRHLLYVAVPGVRNYTEYGGVGVLVYDVAAGHKFIKRIPTLDAPKGQEAENVKGVALNMRTGYSLRHDAQADVRARHHIERICGTANTRAAAIAWRSRPTARCMYLAVARGTALARRRRAHAAT